jgi:hypothetical protein
VRRVTRRTTVLAELFGWVFAALGLVSVYAALVGADWVLGALGVAAVGLGVWVVREMRTLRPRL